MTDDTRTPDPLTKGAAESLREWLRWAGKRLDGVPSPLMVDRIEEEALAARPAPDTDEAECPMCEGRGCDICGATGTLPILKFAALHVTDTLDMERLAEALNTTGHYPKPPNGHIRAWADAIAAEYARLTESQP